MLGISTVWKSGEIKNGQKLIECFHNLGFKNIELEYRISNETYREIKQFLKKEESIMTSSIHNFFPIPEITKSGGADVFRLSSEDEEERALGVVYTIKTIQVAAELGARVVVLHLGMVPMDTIMEYFYKIYNNGKIGTEEHKKALRNLNELRDQKKGKSFDAVLLSLEELVKAAEKHNVFLGIENRYSFREYPNFDELGIIFDKFGSDHIGYWHDIGHSTVNENLGFVGKNELLKAYGKRLLGVHLHDVKGYSDHHVPGAGEVDFDFLKKYLKDDTLKVLEIHPRETEEDLMNGVSFLKRMGID